MDNKEFNERFLSGGFNLEQIEDTPKEQQETGLLIQTQPLYKAAAQRLKSVMARHEGVMPVYLQMEGMEPLHIGYYNLTFDSFNDLNRVIRMYQPYYQYTDGEEFDRHDLLNTVVLPPLTKQDYYMR